jgi:DNA-binding response OmpR family regulator
MSWPGQLRKYRLLLVEDQADLASTVARYLSGFEFEVIVAADGSAAESAFAESRPDIVVLDLGLPDTDGTVLLAAFAQSETPVLVVTGRSEEVDRVVGLELGAVDYVTKPFSLRELLARLRTHLRFAQRHERDPAEPEPASARHRLGDLEVDLAHRRVAHGDDVVELTGAEFELLALLLALDVVSRDDIAERVLHKRFQPGDRSVDQLVHRLRQRLSAHSHDWGTLESVRGVGYRLIPATHE